MSPRPPGHHAWAALAAWGFGVWLLLTWTVQPEQLVAGAIVAALIAVGLAPLGSAVGPWAVLDAAPAIARLLAVSAARIVRANVGLAMRIWRPSRPLSSGMLVVPSLASTPAERAATGLITSLIVDNQIVDLDNRRHMQYHAVEVPSGDDTDRAEHVNRPTERLVRAIAGKRR